MSDAKTTDGALRRFGPASLRAGLPGGAAGKFLAKKGAAAAFAAFRLVFFLGMTYVLLYPVLFLLSNAIRNPQDLLDPTVIWLPKHFTLNNFVVANRHLDFAGSLLRSAKMALPSVVLQVFTCMLVGYGFARFKFKERELLFSLLIFTIIVPVSTIIIPLYVNFRYFDFFGLGRLIGLFAKGKGTINILNTDVPFYLQAFFGMGIRSGLYIYIARQFFRGMPVELEEAATVDGCGPARTYFSIMLPNAGSVLVVLVLFSVVWYWNDYFLPVMFFQDNYPLPVSLTILQERLTTDSATMRAEDIALIRSSVLEAGCILVIGPLLALYVFFQRFFTESISRSGLVG
jgi:multiple sugar transport system permease protein